VTPASRFREAASSPPNPSGTASAGPAPLPAPVIAHHGRQPRLGGYGHRADRNLNPAHCPVRSSTADPTNLARLASRRRSSSAIKVVALGLEDAGLRVRASVTPHRLIAGAGPASIAPAVPYVLRTPAAGTDEMGVTSARRAAKTAPRRRAEPSQHPGAGPAALAYRDRHRAAPRHPAAVQASSISRCRSSCHVLARLPAMCLAESRPGAHSRTGRSPLPKMTVAPAKVNTCPAALSTTPCPPR